MTMRPFTDARSGLNHLVDAQIGRAFPVVHKVYQHLDAIEYVAQVYEAGRSRDIVLRTNHTKEWVEWQYKGEPTWTILFNFSDLLGSDIADVVAAEQAIANQLDALKVQLDVVGDEMLLARDEAQAAQLAAEAAQNAAQLSQQAADTSANSVAGVLASVESAAVVATDLLATVTAQQDIVNTGVVQAQDIFTDIEIAKTTAVDAATQVSLDKDLVVTKAAQVALDMAAAGTSAEAAAVSAEESRVNAEATNTDAIAVSVDKAAVEVIRQNVLATETSVTNLHIEVSSLKSAVDTAANTTQAAKADTEQLHDAVQIVAGAVNTTADVATQASVTAVAASEDALRFRNETQVIRDSIADAEAVATQIQADRVVVENAVSTVEAAKVIARDSATSATASATLAEQAATSAQLNADGVTQKIDTVTPRLDVVDTVVGEVTALRDQTLIYKNAAQDSTTNAQAVLDARVVVEGLADTIATQHTEIGRFSATATAAATTATTARDEAVSANTAIGANVLLAGAAKTSAEAAALAAEGSKDAAALSESNAKASENLVSATAAVVATNAGVAATKAGEAAASAASALASSDNADTKYKLFDVRYLGSKTADPTIDNYGQPLLVGAEYWNSVAGVRKVWSGTEWLVENTADIVANLTTLTTDLDTKAPINNPTFTGTISGVTKAMVGLANVDNTSDLSKPISTATQTAIDAKQSTLVSGTNIKTLNGESLLGGGDLVLSGGGPTLQGDTAPYIAQTKTYQITNYSSFSTYSVSVSSGTVSISGDAITYTAPATAGNVDLTMLVDSHPTVFTITVQAAGVGKPTNISPLDGASGVTESPTLQSSAFTAYGLPDTHLASRWTVYQGGSQVHSSGWRNNALTSYTVPAGVLSVSTTYNWTVEHRGTSLGDSPESTATGFATAKSFNSYIPAPTATPAKFGDPLEGGFYAGMIWNQLVQSATSTTIGVGSKTFTVPDMVSAPIVYAGQLLEIRSRANPANKMTGTVTGALGTSLTINVTSVGGAGTFSDWSIMSRYRVIVAPKASGEHAGIALKNANTALPTACQTLTEGFAATQAMRDADSSTVYPAAHWARNLNIGERTDWYIPARDELELCWRNLKPTTTANYVTANRPAAASFSYANNGSYGDTANTHGTNNNSSPTGAAYTASVPGQTAATAFRTGGAEAYEFGSAYYWSSSDYSASYAWFQYWGSSFPGFQFNDLKTGTYRVRAVRRSVI